MLLFLLTRWRFLYYIPVIGIISVLGGYSCRQITIIRANDSTDVFSSSQTNCSTFCAAKKSLILQSTLSSCVCKCISTAATFVFQGGLMSSACMDNINIRSTIGQCRLLLDGNTIASLVPVFDLSVPGTKLLTGPVNGSSTCNVFQEEILINGTWFVRGGGNLTFKTDNNLLKWSSVSSSPYTGRIVRVQLHCDASRLCIVIKIQGHTSYTIQTALSPTPTISFVGSAHPTTSTTHLSSLKTKDLIPLEPATISPSLATVVMATSSVAVIPHGGTKAVQDECERGAWVFCQHFYLAVAAVGTVVLFVLFIILISWACIRRRRNLRHEKAVAVFFKPGLTTLKEADYNTEIALIEDIKPVNEGQEGQNGGEAFYQNISRREKPDRNQLYRPLRSSDGQDSPTTPASHSRFSYNSSTNEGILHDETIESNQLIKPSQPSAPAGKRFRAFCSSPVTHSKKESLSNQTMLDTEEESAYEMMEGKTLPASGRRRDDDEGISGIENQVFEQDDRRQSHYDKVADEQPNYENLETDYEEDQPNYETMEEHRHGLGLVGKNYTGLGDEEQENYETMDTFSGKEQFDYEIIPAQDEKPEEHDDSGKEKMGIKRECDIPVITEDEHDLLYDIPELSLEVAVTDSHCAGNTDTALTGPNEVKHDDDGGDDDGQYVYANVPDIQANNLREKLRSSWHSGGQHTEETNRGNKTVAEKAPEKRPSSWNTSDAGRTNDKTLQGDDDEELYSLPEDFPKPLPSSLLKGISSPQIKRAEAKNQASPKQKAIDKSNSAQQANEQMKPRDGAPNRPYLGTPKTRKAGTKSSMPASNMMKEQPENSSVGNLSTESREVRKDHQEDSKREGKKSRKINPTRTNKLEKSEGGASSPSNPRSASKEIQERNRRQANRSKKQASIEKQRSGVEQEGSRPEDLINERPLYTNLVEIENEWQTLTNEDTGIQTDQPLYQNVNAMVSHVG